MSYLVVLPWVYEPYKKDCLDSCKIPEENILIIDNTIDNRGVAASWNLGIDEMKARNADWLVILSAAVRFGEPGGMDFIEQLDDKVDNIAIEAAPHLGWHLIAFHKTIFDKVGRFDENLYPAYHEDIDFSNRILIAHNFKLDPPYWTKVPVDATVSSYAHGTSLGGVTVDADRLIDYMKSKWGNATGIDIYHHPFNDPSNSIKYWPEPIRGGSWEK